MSRLLAFLLGAAVVVLTLTVGAVVLEEADTDLQAAAITQAEAACNANLPGDDWTVASQSVNASRLGEVQSVLCTRGEDTRHVNISINFEIRG